MKRLAIASLFLIAFVVIASPVSAQSGAVETVQFQSKLVGAPLPYNVVLPPDYRQSRTTRYPVLYLLHGWAGHYSDWATRTNVADYAAHYRLIVVMPEGNNSWYVDGASGTNDKYESYIVKELLPDVDNRFRTIQSRYGRGVAGLSMGGYGAIKFALKYPSTFAFAGSMSGALAAATWTEDDLKSMKAVYDSLPPVFGAGGSDVRKANDIFQITQALSPARGAALPYLYLDIGTEDFFFDVNRRFTALLHEKKIAHEYRELPGDHSWQYWDRQVREVLKIADEKLRASPLSQDPPRKRKG